MKKNTKVKNMVILIVDIESCYNIILYIIILVSEFIVNSIL